MAAAESADPGSAAGSRRSRRPILPVALLAPTLGPALALLLALLATPARADSLEVALSQPSVRLGETVDLLLRYRPDGPVLPAAPDLQALEGDFRVLDRRQSQRTTIANGRRDTSLDWIVTLTPRREGALSVPAIAIGDAQSSPLDLQVSPARSAAAAGSDADLPPLFLETEVDRSDPYVQGQVVLTARILDAAGMTAAALTDPEVPGAVVERLGEDRSYRERRGGRDYRVIERRFALFPQASGTLEIPPLQLQAQLPPEAGADRPFGAGAGAGFGRPGFPSSFFGGGDPFAGMLARMRQQGFADPFGEMFGRRARLLSQPLTLQVREQPASATANWWLPAEDVRLVEDWEGDSFRLGEPVTRRITLLAKGLTGAQLPELALPDAEGVKQYVEDSGRQTVAQGEDSVTARQTLVSVIPSRAGIVELPEIRVTWWDVAAEQEKVAVLPARSLQVAGAAGGQTAQPGNVTPGAVATPAGRPQPVMVPTSGQPAAGLAWYRLPDVWAAAGGGLLLLGTGGWFVRRRFRAVASAPATDVAGRGADRAALHAAEAVLARACRAGDAPAALDALAGWGRLRWPAAPPRGAMAVAERLRSATLRQAVQALTETAYGGRPVATGHDAAAAALLAAFRDARRIAATQAPAGSALPALYPMPAVPS